MTLQKTRIVNGNIIVKETDKFRVEARNGLFTLVKKGKLALDKAMTLSFGDAVELFELVGALCDEMIGTGPDPRVQADDEPQEEAC